MRLTLLFVALLLPSSAQGSSMPTDPLAGWLFDDGAGTTAADVSGGNDAALQNGASFASGTPFAYAGNGSVAFDGVDDFLTVDESVLSNRSTFSYSGWINPAAGDSNLFSASDVGSFFLYLTNTQRIDYANTGASIPAWVTTPVSLNTWTHVVLVHTGNSVTLYLDGVSQSTFSPAGASTPTLSGPVHLGAWSGPGFYFDGRMDEVAFWDTALTQDEVTWLSQNSLNDIGASSVPEPSSLFLLALAGLCGAIAVRRHRS